MSLIANSENTFFVHVLMYTSLSIVGLLTAKWILRNRIKVISSETVSILEKAQKTKEFYQELSELLSSSRELPPRIAQIVMRTVRAVSISDEGKKIAKAVKKMDGSQKISPSLDAEFTLFKNQHCDTYKLFLCVMWSAMGILPTTNVATNDVSSISETQQDELVRKFVCALDEENATIDTSSSDDRHKFDQAA